jgi:hypothetical protein
VTGRSSELIAHLRVALIGMLLFGSVSLTSGRIRESNGLGYDGVVYGQMVTDGLEEGFPNARLRPLILLVNRAVHRTFGTNVVATFVSTNMFFMFLLALGLALLMERYGAPEYVRTVFVANIALSIATAQMFAYYPVLVDLGALAIMVVAVYFAVAGPVWAAAAATAASVVSREFGMAVVLFGVHRELRLRRPTRALVTYFPAVLVFVAIRWYVQREPADGSPEGSLLTAAELLGNAAYWLSPWFVFFFAYFLVTVFGGLSAFLLVHFRRTVPVLRREHELLSLVVPVLALAALGSADIWRYLVYLLPAAAILFAATTKNARGLAWSLAAVTLFTIVTQRPWREMTEDLYFSHWFPYYAWLSDEPFPHGLLREWAARAAVAAAGLGLLASAAILARQPAADAPQGYHVRR